jgi:hypothetical protein
MGWASTNEDNWEAIGPMLDPVPAHVPPPPCFPCPICVEGFDTYLELAAHLSAAHAQHQPRLLLNGREPSTMGEVIRAPLSADEVDLLHVTTARATVDGRALDGDISARLGSVLAGLREGRVRIWLENTADPGRLQPEWTEYDLDFRIPDEFVYSAVDAAFRDAVPRSGEPLTSHSVSRFVEQAQARGSTGIDYANALACYLNGVLIKDRAPGSGVLPPQPEYEAKYKEAAAGLFGIPRRLPTMVAGLVRFALNDFSAMPIVSGFARLDRVAHQLAPLAGQSWPPLPKASTPVQPGHGGRVCPTDTGTDAVLASAEEIAALPRWGRPAADSLHARIHGLDRFPGDRAKITALAATAALRLGARQDAAELLRRLIQESATFTTWAEAELARLESQ